MKRSQLVEFYLGEGSDHQGRMIDDILSWSDEQLEEIHDYIQWLFPLKERSAFNISAPLLIEADIEAFKNYPKLRKNLLCSFARLSKFYGFMPVVDCSHRRMLKSDDCTQKSCNWLTSQNHNFLRITRILKSLSLLGCGRYAAAFLRALEEVYKNNSEIIGEETLDYWRKTVAYN